MPFRDVLYPECPERPFPMSKSTPIGKIRICISQIYAQTICRSFMRYNFLTAGVACSNLLPAQCRARRGMATICNPVSCGRSHAKPRRICTYHARLSVLIEGLGGGPGGGDGGSPLDMSESRSMEELKLKFCGVGVSIVRTFRRHPVPTSKNSFPEIAILGCIQRHKFAYEFQERTQKGVLLNTQNRKVLGHVLACDLTKKQVQDKTRTVQGVLSAIVVG
jgi:hypothetical protein